MRQQPAGGVRGQRADGVSPRTALHGLAVQDLDRAPGPGVNLVIHHVLEPLVVSGTHKDLRCQLPARKAIIQDLRKIKTITTTTTLPPVAWPK